MRIFLGDRKKIKNSMFFVKKEKSKSIEKMQKKKNGRYKQQYINNRILDICTNQNSTRRMLSEFDFTYSFHSSLADSMNFLDVEKEIQWKQNG